jgi:hypothetical protein
VRIGATLGPEAVGAPLVDRNGHVLGMITGTSLALPVDLTHREALRLATG